VRGVAGRDRLSENIGAVNRADITVLARQGCSGGLIEPALTGVEHAVAIIPAEVGRSHAALRVGDEEIADGDIAQIGDEVAPGHRLAGGDVGAGLFIGILAVGRFLDSDSRLAAEIVSGIAGGEGLFLIAPGGSADILILARHRGGRGRVDPGLARIEQTVAIVAALIDGCDGGITVGHLNLRESDVTRIADLVVPGHRAAHGH